jgi:hypothetical protein
MIDIGLQGEAWIIITETRNNSRYHSEIPRNTRSPQELEAFYRKRITQTPDYMYHGQTLSCCRRCYDGTNGPGWDWHCIEQRLHRANADGYTTRMLNLTSLATRYEYDVI